jgi:hypothetical protein
VSTLSKTCYITLLYNMLCYIVCTHLKNVITIIYNVLSCSRPSTSLQRLIRLDFVWKLAPLADKRNGFFIENLSRRLTRSKRIKRCKLVLLGLLMSITSRVWKSLFLSCIAYWVWKPIHDSAIELLWVIEFTVTCTCDRALRISIKYGSVTALKQWSNQTHMS